MLVVDYFFLSPTHRFDMPGVREAVRLAFFLVEGLTITLLFHQVRRSEAAERQARNQMRDEISRIFQPFVRGASDLPGTGLGLAISKALVERHGGTIGRRARDLAAARRSPWCCR